VVTHNSSNRSNEDNNKSTAYHPKFRGTWTPAEIHYLLADGEISCTEFVLLAVVDSLVDVRGEGCWLSNKALADRIRKDERYTIKLISELCERGFLKRVGWKTLKNGAKLRVLETRWSRITDQKQGVSYRTGRGGVLQDREGGVLQDTQDNTSSSSYEEEEVFHNGRAPSDAPASDNPHTDGFTGSDKPTTDKQVTQDDRELAARLLRCLSENHLRHKGVHLGRWSLEFSRLRRLDANPAEEISRVLTRYITHINAGRMGLDFVPEAYCAFTFREKYQKIKSAFVRLDEAAKPAKTKKTKQQIEDEMQP
jgi:hypothetical protein